MAEEEKKEAEGQEEEEKPKKGFPMKLIIIVLVVVLLGGGGAAAWKMGMLDKWLGKEDKEALAAKPKKEEKPDIGPIYPMNVFIVNLMEPMGKRYLKVKVELELDSEKLLPEVEKRLPQLRDAILTMLSSKSYEDISDLSGKYQLRAEIIAMLNRFLKTGKINNVYFTEFVVQ